VSALVAKVKQFWTVPWVQEVTLLSVDKKYPAAQRSHWWAVESFVVPVR
jgi:hypothetical protein